LPAGYCFTCARHSERSVVPANPQQERGERQRACCVRSAREVSTVLNERYELDLGPLVLVPCERVAATGKMAVHLSATSAPTNVNPALIELRRAFPGARARGTVLTSAATRELSLVASPASASLGRPGKPSAPRPCGTRG
jgi:hypothetical protein